VYGEANQHTADVVITVKDPEGETVDTFDRSATGPDGFQFDTDTAGTYTIQITPFEKASGRYSVTVMRVEPLATTPEGRVDQLMANSDSNEVPGGVVAFIQNGEIVFQRAYGMANLTHGIPFTTETVTNIGSTSKQFTCFSIMLLDSSGQLSIDDDTRTHVPELPDLGATVTLRNCMTHTSGYREFLNALAMGGRVLGEGDYIDRPELIELVQRQPELQNDPGSEWNYNNTAYGLLAVIVGRVTGEEFPEWVKTTVFEPLGMSHTVVRAHRTQIIPNSAQGYLAGEKGGYKEVVDLAGAMGAGGIYTTVGDLARWIRNFKTADVGSEAIFEAMTTPFVLADGDTTEYGFGLYIDEYRGLRRIHHGGADSAHRSMLMYFPDLDAGVVALSNNGAFGASSVANKVAEAFLEEHMEAEDAEGADGPGEFDPASYDPETFDELAGRYELENTGLVLRFFREDDVLYTQATGQPQVEIKPTAELSFTLVGVEADLVFHRNDDGEVTGLMLHQNGTHTAKRLEDEPWAPTEQELQAYTGRYFSAELEAFYGVVVEEGELVVQHRRHDDIKLKPKKDDSFTGAFPLIEVEFVRDDTSAITGFKASNVRTRGVFFVLYDTAASRAEAEIR
jgi:CubicO group peptidase (beta-lactamase class C family)